MSSSEREKKHETMKSRQLWNGKDPPRYDGSSIRAKSFLPRQENLQSPSLRRLTTSTPSRPLLNGRPPMSESYVPLDPCMSPPQIVRKPQSFDDASPDPVFCSKSMSMSIHSSQMLSHSPSTNASGDASFQSDNAMFMEKGEEASSTSNPMHNQMETKGPNSSMQKSSNISISSRTVKNPEVSGHTEPTLVVHSDDETSHEREHGSPYVELLGIRGSFPSTPVMQRPKSPLHQLSRSFVANEPYPLPLVLSDGPSPPPLVDCIVSASTGYSAYQSGAHGLESRKETQENRSKHLSGSSGIKSSFHTIIAKPHPVRSVPMFDVGSRGDKSLTSSKFSLNSALAAKLSKTSVSLQDGDVDVRSVDVKSIRSAFESIMSPLEQVDEKDDEDTASVKSLRERFETPCVPVSLENGITKTRALFEKRSGGTGIRNDVGLKARSDKFIASECISAQGSHETSPSAKALHSPNFELKSDDKDSRSLNEVLVDSSFERKPFSVADRIRAFGGGQKVKPKVELSTRKSIALASKNVTAKDKLLPEQTGNETPLTTMTETMKHSPKRRMSTLRAFGEKAFLCGPPKELLGVSDVDGTVKRSFESIQQDNAGEAILTKNHEPIDSPHLKQTLSSSKNCQGLGVRDVTTLDQVSSARIALVAVERPRDPQFVASKPTWMLQREKILSKSRQPGRVLTAAIESKRETALLLHNDGTKTDVVSSDVCHKVTLDTAVSDARYEPCSHLGETKADITSRETNESTSHVASEKDLTYVRKSPEGPKTLLANETSDDLVANDTSGIENDTIDLFFANPPPAYKLCRSSSENMKPRSKRSSPLKVSSVNDCVNQATAPFLGPNHSVVVPDVTDEKKEEMPSDETFPIRYFGQPENYDSASYETTQGFDQNAGKQVQRTEESGPVVVKPVARKPYVRPVPIKPLVDSLSSIPFIRSVSDPTSRKFSGNSLSQYCQMMDETRPHVKAVADRKYATLALPRLADGDIEPRDVGGDMESCTEGSEFSDGVTLDLSIADVSNLTNPTAIVSKLGGKCHDDNRSESSESVNKAARTRKKGKHDLIDSEAKQSEASSSQTSEAAAPLLARALRTFPLSDEVSTDSFFGKRILVAKQKWSARLDSQRLESGKTENAKEDDSMFNDSLGGIWDIRQVESLFPISTASTLCQTKRISELDDWQPFSPTSHGGESPGNDEEILDPESSSSLSRSKTPTRRNTSQIDHRQPSSHRPPESDLSKANRSYNGSTESSNGRLDSEASYPLLSTGSSSTSARTSRNVVGQLLSSALSGTTSSSSGYYSYMNSGSTPSNKSTVSSSTVSNFGPKHSALLARIHALKESRLRRATRMMTPQSNLRPSTALVDQDFNHINDTREKSVANGSAQSLNLKGGHRFVAGLDLD